MTTDLLTSPVESPAPAQILEIVESSGIAGDLFAMGVEQMRDFADLARLIDRHAKEL